MCAFWKQRKHSKTHKYFASGNFLLIFVLTPLSDTLQHFKPCRRPAATIPKVFSFSPQIVAMIMWLQIWKAALLLKWQVIEWVCAKGLKQRWFLRTISFPHPKTSASYLGPDPQIIFPQKNSFHNRCGLDLLKKYSKAHFEHLMTKRINKTEQHVDEQRHLGMTPAAALGMGLYPDTRGIFVGTWGVVSLQEHCLLLLVSPSCQINLSRCCRCCSLDRNLTHIIILVRKDL